MRSRVFDILRSRGNEYVSGEEIANALGISRAAVWKHIHEMKAMGYKIDSKARKGYRIKACPDKMLPELIAYGLGTKCLGREIIRFEEVPTTNNEAKEMAASGAEEGTVVLSETQSTGKGRLDRGFFCPKGGVWFSVILRPNFLPQEAPKCTLLAAVAVVKAMRELGLDAGIKWPNDILCQGRKLVGILTEMSAEVDKINCVVVGIGINANIPLAAFPEDLQDKAGSMSDFLGHDVDRNAFLQSILRHLETLYFDALEHGFADAFDEWRKYSITLGQEINVFGVKENFSGKAVDIDEDGALLVETHAGMRKVLAGDVSIRPRG